MRTILKASSLLALGFLAGGLLLADVERPGAGNPDRKDGKEDAKEGEGKAEPELGKPGEDGAKAGGDHEALHDKLEAEGRANLKEIARLMEKVRNDLSQKQTGGPTQGDQREVVKKIQELIDKLEKG